MCLVAWQVDVQYQHLGVLGGVVKASVSLHGKEETSYSVGLGEACSVEGGRAGIPISSSACYPQLLARTENPQVGREREIGGTGDR